MCRCAVLLEYEIVQPGVKVNGDYYPEVQLEGEAVVMHQGNIGRQFHIQTGQRTCAHGAIDQWHARLAACVRAKGHLNT